MVLAFLGDGTNGQSVTTLNLGSSYQDYGWESPGKPDHLRVRTEGSGGVMRIRIGTSQAGANIYT